MGGAVSSKGIKLEFYDANGNLDTTRPALQFPVGYLTGQDPTIVGAGSADWLKEVYLAPDNISLHTLVRNPQLQPTGKNPPLTSAASLNVKVSYIDENHQPQSELWKSAVALGTDVNAGTDDAVRLIDKLLVTKGDARDSNNKLHRVFEEAKLSLMLKIEAPPKTP